MTASRAGASEVWVCLAPPAADPPNDAVVLSFMTPSQEAEAEARWGERFVSARLIAQEVRDEARRLYLDVIGRIGATPLGGRTLREALRGSDGWSRWWFLKTSEKNSLWDRDVYGPLIQLLCIKRVAERVGARRLRLCWAPAEFATVLAGSFEIVSSDAGPRHSTLRAVGRGFLARAASLLFYLRMWWILRRGRPGAPRPLDVLLEAHWDWSVQPERDGQLRDRYFSDLPRRLEERGLAVGWLAWCEPDTTVWQRGRSLGDVVAAALRHPRIVLAERYLRPRDILRSTLDLRYLVAFLRFARRPGFRELFRVGGLDLHTLLRRQILELLAGSSLGRWDLFITATRRACAEARPKLVLTFLEVFLHSRAIFAGARLALPGVKLWAAQHASYCRDKTFGLVDPARELGGEPDGCRMPAPDGLFVMGELSSEIWVGNGFPAERVVVTGGLRYQHVRLEGARRRVRQPPVILLAASMIGPAELDLCDAICAAARGLPVRIRLRDHPLYCLSERPEFASFRDRIEVTGGTSVIEDLAAADLALFTHSGVSEEALALGLPVWQWLGAGINTSVFLDLPRIPTFTSVAALRRGLESFLEDPTAYRPRREVQEEVVRQCFGPYPAGASAAIAERIVELLQADMVTARV